MIERKGSEPTASEPDAAIEILRASGLVDEGWYRRHYPDIADGKMDPVRHYIEYGAAEGRNPNSHFDTRWYVESYLEVFNVGMNPLLHYIQSGAAEGRATCLAFDTAYYLEQNSDIATSDINPLLHFLRFGFEEARIARPHPFSRVQRGSA